ncbi:MAG: PaaI family thioesterase [Candidatus Hydrogenedentes bacterium]|nr:PaaI family thioesterase [Candidatus Hydrogenedentota bacterium]
MPGSGDARLAGYSQWEGVDPFEDYIGPLFYKEEDGIYRCAFVVTRKHVNGQGGLHGGMMMSFADYALFMFARNHLEGGRAVTVTFNAEFASVAQEGEFVEATGEVVHETRGMLFMRGSVFSGDRVILNFSGVLKKLRPE